MESFTEKKDNLFVTVTFRKSPAGKPNTNVQHVNIDIDEKHDENGEFLEVKVHRLEEHRKHTS